jgi:hypothetical protein
MVKLHAYIPKRDSEASRSTASPQSELIQSEDMRLHRAYRSARKGANVCNLKWGKKTLVQTVADRAKPKGRSNGVRLKRLLWERSERGLS